MSIDGFVMAVPTANADITITAFQAVPDFARGNVRDLVVRWMLEEMGRPYRTHLLDGTEPRGAEYLAWQPFDQVPALRDGDLELFESGAILLYLGEQDERLLPRDPVARAKVVSWLFAALNSVELPVRPVATLPLFHGDKAWTADAVAALTPLAEGRLQRVVDALGDKEWIAGDFSIADIMLIFLLRTIGGELAKRHDSLDAYIERGCARPAFERALQAQLDDLDTEMLTLEGA